MKHYANIVFMQNAEDFADFVDPDTGETGDHAFFGASLQAQFDFLCQWDNGDGCDWQETSPYGSCDRLDRFPIDKHSAYVLSVNSRIGYAGLTLEMEGGAQC